MTPNSPRYAPRAERFAIPVAILYRSPGESEWRPGLTENISRSGVLFRADRPLAANTPVELMLDMPSTVTTSAAGTALRRGRIVRAIPPTVRTDRPAFAAAFIDFHSAPPVDPRRI